MADLQRLEQVTETLSCQKYASSGGGKFFLSFAGE